MDRESALEELRFYLVCAYALLVPLTVWSLVFRAFSLPKALVAYVLVLALCACALFAKKTAGGNWTSRALTWLPFCFCLSLIPAAVFSIDPPSAFLGGYRQLGGAAYWIILAAFGYCVGTIRWDEERLSDLGAVIAITAAIVSALALIQAWWPPINQVFHAEEIRRPVFGTLGNAGYLGVFLAFAIPVVFAKMANAIRRPSIVFYGAVLSMAAGALAFTGARTGWMAGAVGLTAAVVVITRLRSAGPKAALSRSIAIPALLALGFFVGAMISPATGVDRVSGTAASRIAAGSGTLEARSGYWVAAAKTTAAKPLTGAGPDTFGLVYPGLSSKVNQSLEPDIVTDQAHNLFLQMSATLGVPALLIFLGLLILSARAIIVFLASKTEAAAGPDKILAAGLAAGALGHLFAVQATVDSWGTSFIPWLFIGLAGSLAKTVRSDAEIAPVSPPNNPRPLGPANSLISAALVIIVVLTSVALNDLAGLYRADRLFAAAQLESPDAAAVRLESVVRLWPNNETYWLELAKARAQTDPRAAERAAREAVRVALRSYLPYQFLAQFYLTDGKSLPGSRISAHKAVNEALRRFPNSPELARLKAGRSPL